MNSSLTAETSVRIFGACSFFLWATINITLNVLLAISLKLGRESFARNAFYTITWQLVACDLTSNTLEFFISIPLTLSGKDLYGETIIYFPCFFETLSYNGTLYFSVLMTVNRITVFLFPQLNRFLFQEHLKALIGALWLSIIVVLLTWNYVGCYKTFSSTGFFYYYLHTEPPDSLMATYIGNTLGFLSTYMPIAMFISYVVMIISIQAMLHFDFTNWKIRQSGLISFEENHNASVRREFSLLAQAFMICGVLEANNLVFSYLPKIAADGQWRYVMTFVGRWISLSVTSINAIVLFSFNRDIRRKLKRFIMNSLGTTSTVPTSHTSSHHH